MESRPYEKKDRLICFKAFSRSRQTGRSTESIPRIFGSFKNGSSIDDSIFRRSRSFSLPRILKRDKEEKQNFSFSFSYGTKTKQKEACSSERPSMKSNGRDNGVQQKCKRLNGEQSYQESDASSSRENTFVIPKICIQTPEEVNLILQLHTITKEDSIQHFTHDRENTKEGDHSTKEDATPLYNIPNITISDNNDKRKGPRRKRSASWSDAYTAAVYSSEDRKISSAGLLKHSMSWSAFFDSDTSRETDLCSTEL